MQLPPGEVLVEQLGKLLGHDASQLLCVGYRHGAPVIAGDVVAYADGQQLYRLAGLDFLYLVAEVTLQI